MFTFGWCPSCTINTLHERRDYRGERFYIYEHRKLGWGRSARMGIVEVPVAICTICNSANQFGKKSREVISYGIRYVDSLRTGDAPKLPDALAPVAWQEGCKGRVQSIPALLHAFWCGPSLPAEHVQALTKWLTLNRHVKLRAILWTEGKDLVSLARALDSTEVTVRCVSDLDGSEELLKALETETNPVARSDVLRQLILLNCGGIYVDCGTEPSGMLPERMAFVFHPKVGILAGKTRYIENRVIVMDKDCPVACRLTREYLANAKGYYAKSRPVSTLYALSLQHKQTQLVPFSGKALRKPDVLAEILQLASYFLDRDTAGDDVEHATRTAEDQDTRLSGAFDSIGYRSWREALSGFIGYDASLMHAYLINFVAPSAFISQLNSWRYPQMNKLIGLGRQVNDFCVQQREQRLAQREMAVALRAPVSHNPFQLIQAEFELLLGAPIRTADSLRTLLRSFITTHAPEHTHDEDKLAKFERARALFQMYLQLHQSKYPPGRALEY